MTEERKQELRKDFDIAESNPTDTDLLYAIMERLIEIDNQSYSAMVSASEGGSR